MNRKIIHFIAWALVVLLGLGVVTDAALSAGFTRGVQYAYNAFYFFVALPVLLVVAMREKEVADGR